MSHPETCPGCQRAVIDVRTAVRACDDGANGTPQRCAWRSLQQQAMLTSAPWPDTVASQPERSPVVAGPREASGAKPLSPSTPASSPASQRSTASTDVSSADASASAQQQLAEEQAARRSLREQLRTAEAIAAEAQAIRAGLFDELERTRAELARARTAAVAVGANGHGAAPTVDAGAAKSGPVLVDPAAFATSAKGSSASLPPASPLSDASARRSPAGAPRRTSLQLGLLALGAVIGIALGAAGVEWLRTSSEPPLAMQLDPTLPAAQPLASTADGARASAPALALAQSAAQAASATAAVATADGASNASARSSTTPAVAGAAPSADLRARLQTALAAEGVAGAVDVAPDTTRVTVADPAVDRATRIRTDTIIRSVYAGAQLPEPSIEHRWVSQSTAERLALARRRHAADDPIMAAANAHDDLMTLGAPAAGGRMPASASIASASGGATRSVVLPAGRITASCNEKTARATLLSQSWVMWGCMRSKCCASSAAEHGEECQAYSKSYPLSCPR